VRVAIVAPARSRRSLQLLCELVHGLNVLYLRAHPTTPRLYQSGVVYRREPRGCDDTACREERWCTIPVTLGQGWGDCDDLAPWRSAELEVRERVPARPRVVRVPSARGRRWHVVVEHGDGRLEDPSAALGMGEP
jgi:hypothetical protein